MTVAPQPFWRRFLRNRAAAAGLAILACFLALGVLGPFLHPGNPLDMVGRPFLWPGTDAAFPLGTDNLGRDVLSGLIEGCRISGEVGLSAAAAAIMLGITIGAAAGYAGGRIDDVLMRLTEVFQTMPSFLFVLVVVAILKPTLPNVVFAIASVSWPAVARIVRADILSLRDRDFVLSCRTIGMGRLRIITTQLLPNCLGPVIVMASMLVASAILTEAALSFLNLSDENVVSWGRMVGIGRDSLREAWYLSAIPGFAILLVVLALNLVGEGIGDALNPRLRDG